MLGFTRFQISLGFWVPKPPLLKDLQVLNFGGSGGGGSISLEGHIHRSLGFPLHQGLLGGAGGGIYIQTRVN